MSFKTWLLSSLLAHHKNRMASVPFLCLFIPTCSEYMVEAIDRFGWWKGFQLGVRRLRRCSPNMSRGGVDPVPEK